MSDYNHEQISALMDGELTEDQFSILNTMKNNQECRKIWSHYHLIGESLRGNLPPHIDMKLAERISIAIKDEPAILAPKPKSFTLTDYFKPAMGFAIAASVTVAVIFGVRQTSEVPSFEATQQTAAVQQQAPQINPVQTQARVATVSSVADNQSPSVVRTFETPTDARSRLNRYLVNHNEYRTNTGVQGMLPYVRIVAHEVEE